MQMYTWNLNTDAFQRQENNSDTRLSSHLALFSQKLTSVYIAPWLWSLVEIDIKQKYSDKQDGNGGREREEISTQDRI